MTKYGLYEQERALDASLLATAGATIYSPEFAERYRRLELMKYPPGLITRFVGDSWADGAKAALAGVVALSVMFYGSAVFSALELQRDLLLLGQIILAVIGFTATFLILDKTLCRIPPRWETYMLNSYGFYDDGVSNRITPEFARDLLKNITALVPDATFAISVLGWDPIITCTTQGGTYVVLIYDGDTIIREE